MKRVLSIGIILLVMFLAACGQRSADPEEDDQNDKEAGQTEEVSTEPEEEPVEEVEDTEVVEEVESEEQAEDTSPSMTDDELRELIEYTGMGEGDELVSATIEGEEIKAVINLGESDPLSDEDLAVTRYSQVSDELLNHEDWNTLTIEYSGVGTVSMDRSETESNEFGEYFPTLEIEDRLK